MFIYHFIKLEKHSFLVFLIAAYNAIYIPLELAFESISYKENKFLLTFEISTTIMLFYYSFY